MTRRATAALATRRCRRYRGTAAVQGGNAKDRFDLKGEVYGDTLFKIEMKNGRPQVDQIKAGTYGSRSRTRRRSTTPASSARA